MDTFGFVELADVIDRTQPEATGAVMARVTRIDKEGTVWVHYDGGVSETPLHRCDYAVNPGDSIPVTTRKGRAVADGNATDIPASSARTEAVNDTAVKAVSDAAAASTAAYSALGSAEQAAIAAASAQTSATRADAAAQQAISDAAAAQESADTAQESADIAQASATQASTYAGAALGQLGIVQDVIGVLDWASAHGSFVLTQDTEIDDSKVYFTLDAQTGDYMPVVDPQASQLSTYYELSMNEAMNDFILAHLAVTQRGLWVLPGGMGQAQSEQYAPGYKVLLSAGVQGVQDAGMYIYDGNGALVRSSTDSGDDYASGRPWHIGSNDAYILYTPASGQTPASITIGGANVNLGTDKTLSELLTEVDGTVVFKVTEEYNAIRTAATVTAHVYRGGDDIASSYPDSSYAWYIKRESGQQALEPLGNGRTITVQLSEAGYGAAVVCRFTPPNDAELLTQGDDTLTSADNTPLSVRSPSGDYVRVADLTVETTVFGTDKVMVVGSEDEHLVTVEALKDAFGGGDYERLSNKPSIEGVSLSGDKGFDDLGIFRTDSHGYPVADDYTLSTMDINQLWANAQPVG